MASLDFRKLLLVHPLGYNAASAMADISRKANIMPPLGLASMAAYLEREGIATTIVDCYARPDSHTFIDEFLRRERPAFVGFSCTTSSFLDGVDIARRVKKIVPGMQVVFGGPHVSALKEAVLEKFPDIDFCVVGEGEQTLLDLLVAEGRNPDQIPGLVCRRPEGIVFTGYRKKLLELDDLPFPAYEKLTGYPEAYTLPIFNYPRTPNSSCISSRGCPYACSYCDRSVFRKSFRYNSAEYLYEHVRYLQDRFNIRHLNFYDDQFTFNRERVMEFTRLLIDRRTDITFNCAVRADHIDLEMLSQMKAAGCWMVSLGIETGDENLLAQHRQKADLVLLKERILLLKKAGLRIKGLLMMGLPGESEQSIARSMEYVFSLPIDDINVSKFTPFPGAPLYENIHQLGTFEEDWPKMDCMNFQFIPHGMKREQLEKLHQNFYKSHFMRHRILWSYVAMLWKSPDSWRRFIKDAGHFISFALSSKRMQGD